MSQVFGEKLLMALLSGLCKQPLGKIGWMGAVRGITLAAEAYLADPELKLMIVEEQSFEVEAQSVKNFQTAKKKRPDVTFIVLISTHEEEDHDLYRKAGAEYVVDVNIPDLPEHLAQIVDDFFSK